LPDVNNNDEEEGIDAVLNDPAIFASAVLNIEPFPYQSVFLRNTSKRILVCAGRQVGKSFMTAARAIWFATTHQKTNTLIVSATLRQSMLMFDKIWSMIESSSMVRKSVAQHSRTSVSFKNGSSIIALPCGRSGSTLRGFTAHLIIIDEAAFVPERVISEVVLPMLATTQGTAILLSTPFDKNHIFYKAFTSPKWSKYHFPSSINPHISSEFLEEQKELHGELAFRQEYLAEFVDDEKSYFPMPLIRQCVHTCENKKSCEYCELLLKPEEKLLPPRKLYAGYDPGGRSDPAALVVLEKLADQTLRVCFLKMHLEKKNNEDQDENLYTRFTAEIKDLHDKMHFQKLMVDSTGLGSPIVEHCKGLKLPAEGLQLTLNSKEQILSNLRLLLEKRKIILPDDLTLVSNLNCIEAARTGAGHFTFSHPRGSHDDLAFALALACWAAAKSTPTTVMIRLDQASCTSFMAI